MGAVEHAAGVWHAWRGARFVLCCLWLAAMFPGVHSARAAEPAAQAADPTLTLLGKIQNAARQLDYAGVFTYQQGAVLQSTRIAHIVDGTGERERLEALDGAPGESLRHNDAIERLVPERKIVILESRRPDGFPGLLINDGHNIPAHYNVRKSKRMSRVAGRDCVLFEVLPKDHDRYGHRYCADAKTNLLLKAQTLGAGGNVIDQIAFTALKLGDAVKPDQLDQRWDTKGWKVLRASLKPVDLGHMGWRIPAPAGFVDVAQVRRPMTGNKQVNQLVLSDGLAAISVFIEPFDKANERALPRGAVRKGALNIYGTRIGNHWFTVVGEVPARTLRDIAKRTEYVPLASSR